VNYPSAVCAEKNDSGQKNYRKFTEEANRRKSESGEVLIDLHATIKRMIAMQSELSIIMLHFIVVLCISQAFGVLCQEEQR